MIRSKKEYIFYLESDRIALGKSKLTWKIKIKEFLIPSMIWKFQRSLRKMEYYRNVKNTGIINKIIFLILTLKFRKLSLKLGFSIPINVFGPGLAIVHYGTIVVNHNASIGANCRIHASTNIGASGGTDKAPKIGDNVYIAPGAIIFGNISIPNNTAIGANAAVNRSFTEENTLIAGVPAKVVKKINISDIIKHI